MSSTQLRFALLILVSTEQQKKRGESLRTQETYLKKVVSDLGGSIAKIYAGQEHAVDGSDRQLFEQLLTDANKQPKPFDAVIITDLSRWTRDEEDSARSIKILKKNSIRFFVMSQELDLFNSNIKFLISIQAACNSFSASTMKEKSLINRIHRAERGLLTVGKRPFGRTFDSKTGKWDIDKEKQKMIEDIAKRYLMGEHLADLAEEFGLSHSNLHKVLTQRSDTTWEQNFDCPDFKIRETVVTKVPLLLPDKIIDAIKRKVEANKTYQHGQNKHQYLLSRMIFCSHCEYAMTGQPPNHNGHKYYRHANKRLKECNRHKAWVLVEEIEDVVMRHLFECFGNPQAIQKAIEKAIPNKQRIQEHQH
jgi:DNA invertase Pin-like site-specific DNA recombinase